VEGAPYPWIKFKNPTSAATRVLDADVLMNLKVIVAIFLIAAVPVLQAICR